MNDTFSPLRFNLEIISSEASPSRFQQIVTGTEFHNAGTGHVRFSVEAVGFGRFAENQTTIAIRTGATDYGLLAQRRRREGDRSVGLARKSTARMSET